VRRAIHYPRPSVCRLTKRSSGRVGDKVPRPYVGGRPPLSSTVKPYMYVLFFRLVVAALLSIATSVKLFATEAPSASSAVVVPDEHAPWLTYDAGKLRILESAESTGGRYSVLELNEVSAYKTPPHMHPDMDETFYVLEGTLELRLPGKTYRLGAGSYAHVPRNTPHAQGSADNKAVRVLITLSPGEFEAFFLERVGLLKRIPRGHPDFQRLYLEIVRKHAKWLQPASLEPPTTGTRER
jgi:mannose-6-phosphate isomerase-like protein (cupin superfamily)